jgi:Xaa-Pro aminopeptidase
MLSRSFASLWMTIGLCLATATAEAQVGSPAGAVPVERLQARRSALLAKLGTGVAIIPSAKVRSIEGDYPQDSDYRENNDFFYLTGLEAPGAWLVLLARKNGRNETILYLPARDTSAEKWTGPKLGPGPEATRLTGINDVRASERATVEIPGFGAPIPMETLDKKIGALRLVKDRDEIGRLRQAITITSDALNETMAAARPGMWEYQLEALIEYGFRRRGAERVGFPSIIGSGPNGATLHYDKNRRQVQPGDLVVEDVGAEFGYYTADVTRTIPISGSFTPRQRALYDLVLTTQQAAIDAVHPGTNLATLNRVARDYMMEHSGDLCGAVTCVTYFTHGLSHWLGMDVHDVGSFGAELQPGMVLTVEPGIYLPAEGLGIRIEDDVLVTPGGHEILSQAAPRTSTEIEQSMRQKVP